MKIELPHKIRDKREEFGGYFAIICRNKGFINESKARFKKK